MKQNCNEGVSVKLFALFICQLLLVQGALAFYQENEIDMEAAKLFVEGYVPVDEENGKYPPGWFRGPRAEKNELVRQLRINLPLNQNKLNELTDGTSISGTPAEIRSWVGPSKDRLVLVLDWIKSAGFSEEMCVPEWASYRCVDVPVFLVENLLNVKVFRYRHIRPSTSVTLATQDNHVLPNFIELVTGLNLGSYFPKRSPKIKELSKEIFPDRSYLSDLI